MNILYSGYVLELPIKSRKLQHLRYWKSKINTWICLKELDIEKGMEMLDPVGIEEDLIMEEDR